MDILYLPIFEPGANHATAVKYKRGLHDALLRAGHTVIEVDYCAYPHDTFYADMAELIETVEPDLVLSQFHGADWLTPDQIRALRNQRPAMQWINWSGDSWLHSLTAPAIVDMAREFDWQLTAAPDVLPAYEAVGVRSGYWQIAHEPAVEPLPDAPCYDVLWLANVINDKRRSLMEWLKALPGIHVGIYGDWEHADGRCTYNFPMQQALYCNATLAIADNVYQDQQNYISDRPINCLAAGGALLLHQHVPDMKRLTYGWKPAWHYIEWHTRDDLGESITRWLRDEYAVQRRFIVQRGQQHVLRHHTFDARVRQLFSEYVKVAQHAAH